jgi:hypothetical protein
VLTGGVLGVLMGACWACWVALAGRAGRAGVSPRDLGKSHSMVPSKTDEILAALDQEVSTERFLKI